MVVTWHWIWKKSCFQEKRPTILLNYPERIFPATSGMWTKQSFTRARICLQLLWLFFFFFFAFALKFQWGHLPQKIVCGRRVFGKTPSEGSPDSNHKRHVSKQFNFLFVMWVTRVTGRLGCFGFLFVCCCFFIFLIEASWELNF